MKKIWVSENSYNAIKTVAKKTNKSMIDTVNDMADTYTLLINSHIEQNCLQDIEKEKPYMTCKALFFEQNKHLLSVAEQEYYNKSALHVNEYIQKHIQDYNIFLAEHNKEKEKLRKLYKHNYYIKKKSVNGQN